MAYELITLEVSERIATVTVNRPDKMNALNDKVVQELGAAFASLKDNKEVGVVILTGAGPKAFIAGADIKKLSTLDQTTARSDAKDGQKLTRLMETLGKPVIAAINGWALGGGCELAMACTLRVASEKAKLGQPEVNLGLIPGYGGSQRLPRIVGQGRALEMILTGAAISAAEAQAIGLVNRVVPPDKVLEESVKLAKSILAVGPVAVEYALAAVDKGMSMPLDQALELEAEYFGLCFTTEDMKEGTAAFLEKRAPKFTGR